MTFATAHPRRLRLHRPRIAFDEIRVVSWDVDGTLYDEGAMRKGVLWAAARDPIRATPELLSIRRFNWAVEASRRHGGALGDAAERFDRARSLEVEARWIEPVLARVGPRPGVLRALEAVRERGLPQVVLSDYRCEYKLRALGIAGCFDATFAGETLGFVKPHPKGLLEIAASMGVEPRAILHVGDRLETDGAAARAAGAQSIIVGRHVADLWELTRWLREALPAPPPATPRR